MSTKITVLTISKVKREQKLELQCVAYAKKSGWLAYKISFVGVNGAPDRLFISGRGSLIFIEFKAPIGSNIVVSALQQKMHKEWGLRSVKIYICRSLDYFCEILEDIEKREIL